MGVLARGTLSLGTYSRFGEGEEISMLKSCLVHTPSKEIERTSRILLDGHSWTLGSIMAGWRRGSSSAY
jgi:hypothetical protein